MKHLSWTIVAWLAAMAATARGEDLGISAGFLQQVRQQVQFRVVRGELTACSPQQNGQWESSTRSVGQEERLRFDTTTARPTIRYERKTPIGQFSFVCEQGSEFTIRREAVGNSVVAPLEFKQHSRGVELTVVGAGKQESHQAASLWHLLLAEPVACRQHLLPLILPLRDNWSLEAQAGELEQALIRLGREPQGPGTERWSELVAHLGSEEFSVRDEADRQLRTAGPGLLPYLQGLPRNRLDAEQWRRVRGIIKSLTGGLSEDGPEQTASRLAGDPRIWVSLLSRDSEETRRLAASRLTALWGETVLFEPAGEPSLRQKQLLPLRDRAQRTPPPEKPAKP